MSSLALGTAVIAAVTLVCAWREVSNDNVRDAKLLAGFGAGGLLATVFLA